MKVTLDEKTYIRNVGYLSIVQIFNFIFPLAILSFVTNKLGLYAYGELVFMHTLVVVGVAFAELSLSWTGVRELSSNKGKKDIQNRLYSIYTAIHFIGSIVVCIILFIVYALGFIQTSLELMLASLFLILCHLLAPPWLLQGLEEMKLLAIFTVLSKCSYFILLVILVKDSEDISSVLVAQACGLVLPAFFVYYFLHSRAIIKIHRVTWIQIYEQLRKLFELFISRIYTIIYGNSAALTLGFFGYTEQLALFNIADKIQKATRVIINPITEAALPRISAIRSNNSSDAKNLAGRILLVTAILVSCVSLFVAFYSKEIILLIASDEFLEAPQLLKLFLLVPVLIALSTVLGVHLLIPFGHNTEFRKCLELGLIVCLIIVMPLCYYYQAFGAVISVIITELTVSTAMMIVVLNKGLLWTR